MNDLNLGSLDLSDSIFDSPLFWLAVFVGGFFLVRYLTPKTEPKTGSKTEPKTESKTEESY